MERKTLLFQPSGQADKRAYTQASAPAGAFGDAGGAMAGFGRDIQSLGGSVAQISQVKQAAQNRKDTELSGLRSSRREQLMAETEQTLSQELQDQNSEGFKAQERGEYAAYADKIRRDRVLPALDAEFPLSKMANETVRQQTQMGEDTMFRSATLPLIKADEKTKYALRQTAVNSSTDTYLGERMAAAGTSSYNILDALKGLNSEIDNLVGVDRAEAKTYAVNQSYKHLQISMANNPENFLLETSDKAGGFYTELRNSGFSDQQARNLFRRAEPSDENYKTVLKDLDSRLAHATTTEQKEIVLGQIDVVRAKQVASGKLGPVDAGNQSIEDHIQHIQAPELIKSITLQQFNEFKDAEPTIELMAKVFGKNTPLTEKTVAQLNRVKVELEQEFEQARNSPVEWSTKRNPRVAELGGQITQVLASGDLEAATPLQRAYNEEIYSTLENRGVARALTYNPSEDGGLFLPKEAAGAMTKFVMDQPSQGRGSAIHQVRRKFGPTVLGKIAATLSVSSKPEERDQAFVFAASSAGGSAKSSGDIANTISAWVTRASELRSTTEERMKDPEFRKVVETAYKLSLPKIEWTNEQWAAISSGKIPSDIDASHTWEAYEMAVASLYPGISKNAVRETIVSAIAASAIGRNVAGVPDHKAANRAAGEMLGQLVDSGVVAYTTPSGIMELAPHFTQSARSIVSGNLVSIDDLAASGASELSSSYATLNEGLTDRLRTVSIHDQSGFFGRAFIGLLSGGRTARSAIGVPFRHDIRGDTVYADDTFAEFLFQKTWKDLRSVLPDSTGGVGVGLLRSGDKQQSIVDTAFSPAINLGAHAREFVRSVDGQYMVLVSTKKATAGVLHGGLTVGSEPIYFKDGTPVAIPMERWAAAASVNLNDDEALSMSDSLMSTPSMKPSLKNPGNIRGTLDRALILIQKAKTEQ